MTLHRRASSSRQHLVIQLHLQDKMRSFEESNVQITAVHNWNYVTKATQYAGQVGKHLKGGKNPYDPQDGCANH